MDIKFNIFEIQALLEVLKEYCTRNNLSNYEGYLVRHLFLAFLKLQKASDSWHEGMSYTE